MREIWLWISKEVVDVMIGLVGLLIVLAWFVITYLIGEFKRKNERKKKAVQSDGSKATLRNELEIAEFLQR